MTILLALMLGILCGYGLRQRQRLLVWVDQVTMLAIYLLLLLLGLSVGTNQAVMQALGVLGWQAFCLSIASVGGSVLLAALLYRWLFAKDEK